MAPVVPMRRKVRIPSWASSSTAMEVDGPPMPVEQMITALPSISPRQVVNSMMAGQVHRVIQQLCDALHALGVTGNDRQGGALQIRFLQTQVKYIRHSGLLVASRRLAAERS